MRHERRQLHGVAEGKDTLVPCHRLNVSLAVTDLLPEGFKLSGSLSTRHLTTTDMEAVDLVAKRVATEVEALLAKHGTQVLG